MTKFVPAALSFSLVASSLVAQPPRAASRAPVLAFPEPGLDDSAAYQGYQTRLYRDAAGNTVQVYLDGREGRVVTLLADAEDESVGFSARTANRPAPLRWDGADAEAARSGATRTFAYHLRADARDVAIGLFQLGSMRVERDLQYALRQRGPLGGTGYVVTDFDRLVAALGTLPPDVRRRHLALLNATDVDSLRARLRPRLTIHAEPTLWTARVRQPALDARDTLELRIEVDPRVVEGTRAGDTLVLHARSGASVPFTVRVATTGRALTPLTRGEIFSDDFLAFLDSAKRSGATNDAASIRARRLERQVRGVELLSSREKLMAGLPTYATYFGRDMMVSALMMRSIWRGATSEAVIGSVLRKLGPAGDVSHEEALGGQAIREGAGEYASLLAAREKAGDVATKDSLLARATAVLRDLRRVRENYHMIDDEMQLPVLVSRWLDDATVPAAQKRAFLLDSTDGQGSRAVRLLRELALVARMTAAYARDPRPTNLVSFAPRDDAGPDGPQWSSASWRDSGVGYAGGRYPMDVNAIWAPHALESIGRILAGLRAIGLAPESLAGAHDALAAGTPLGTWARDTAALRHAVDAWRGAERHFVVRLAPAEVRAHVDARLAAMPADERAYWTPRVAAVSADSLAFLAVSLDATGQPIGVANTDPATRLFLGESESARGTPSGDEVTRTLRDARLFTRAYPAGLLVAQVGPVAANDAYATPAVWQWFVRDPYHGPRVVWGREVNLFLLGAAAHASAAARAPSLAPYASELRDAITRVRDAVAASGFHSELWSYGFANGRLVPTRYGSGADVQLWSTTDLAVEYALARLGAR